MEVFRQSFPLKIIGAPWRNGQFQTVGKKLVRNLECFAILKTCGGHQRLRSCSKVWSQFKEISPLVIGGTTSNGVEHNQSYWFLRNKIFWQLLGYIRKLNHYICKLINKGKLSSSYPTYKSCTSCDQTVIKKNLVFINEQWMLKWEYQCFTYQMK